MFGHHFDTNTQVGHHPVEWKIYFELTYIMAHQLLFRHIFKLLKICSTDVNISLNELNISLNTYNLAYHKIIRHIFICPKDIYIYIYTCIYIYLHLQRVALKPIYPNHPNIIYTYHRPGNNRLPRIQFGYPGPKSLFRAHSLVIPDRSLPSAHTVRFYRTPTSNFIRRDSGVPCKPAWLRETPYTTFLSPLQILRRTDV